MLVGVHLGGYGATVVEFRRRLHHLYRCHEDEKLKIVAVGHGGRDAWLALAVVEAVATDAVLRSRSSICILSSTWPEAKQKDDWESTMESYLTLLHKGLDLPQFVRLIEFRWNREHSVIVRELTIHFEDAHVILQCEQGLDYFVAPGRFRRHPFSSPFLQDNYEDWLMLYEGMWHVEKNWIIP